MPDVELRWRPSGGRGEYEHVPQDVLLGRNIVIDPISVPNARIKTDAWGRIKDGKPRIRRENPNDRQLLNVAQLVAALALLPDPIREDKGSVVLPLRDKAYVISAISFRVIHADERTAVCIPQRLKVLHDNGTIDLVDRLRRIGEFLGRSDTPTSVRKEANDYRRIAANGVSSADFRSVANHLIAWLTKHPEFEESIETPSDDFLVDTPAEHVNISLDTSMTADETKRRLVAHYRIDRNRKIRRAKVKLFKNEHGDISCENCSFDFEQKYGERGNGFIEVHHLLPLAALLPNSITSLSDLILLCSNCHRMVHRTKPLLDANSLREITRLEWIPSLRPNVAQ